MGRFIEGVKSAVSYLFTYATIVNVVLVVSYAFKDTNYTFGETLKYHFSFAYFYILVPLFVATLIGKKLLFTEYPKLSYVVMPLLCLLPYIFIRPGKCGVTCDSVDLYVGIAAALLLAVRTAVHMYNDHGEYMEFSHQKKLKSLRVVAFVFLNILVVGGIFWLNSVHERNDAIIFDLDSYSADSVVSECSKIMFNNEKKALCLLFAASKNHDVAICKSIRRLITENEDADRCYYELATFTGDISHCNSMMFKDEKYECYYSFALSDDVCAIIDDSEFQVNCFADCDKIADVTMKDSCFTKRAMDTNDVSFCNRISEADEQQECQEKLVAGASDCDLIDDIVQKDDCFISIAREDADVSLCNKLSDAAKKDSCVKDLATEKEQCDTIESNNVKEVCLAELATDANECAALSSVIAKDACYDAVAQATSDSGLCDQISDSSKKTLCQTRLS